MKRVLSLFLALLMVFSIALPVLADEEVPVEGENLKVTITATNPNNITVENKATFEQIKEKIEVIKEVELTKTIESDPPVIEKKNVAVVWTLEGLEAGKAGTYTLPGTFTLPDGWEGEKPSVELKVIIKEAIPLVKEVSWPEGLKDTYKFENFSSKDNIVKAIEEDLRADIKNLYYVVIDKGVEKKVLVPVNELIILVKDFELGKPGVYDVELKFNIPSNYEIADGVVTTKTIKAHVGNNILRVKELAYTLDGKKYELKLDADENYEYKGSYNIVLPKGTLSKPVISYEMEEESKGYVEEMFKQMTAYEGDKEWTSGAHIAKLILKSEDGSREAVFTITFTREQDPLVDTRIAGDDRIQTSIEMSKKFFLQADTVIIASSSNEAYVDALAAAPLADLEFAPILLNPVGTLDSNVKSEIKRLGAKKVIIVGGESSLSPAVISGLSGYTVKRVAGDNRFLTSVAIAKEVFEISDSNRKVVIVDGTNYPDALASSVFANPQGIPILLTSPGALNPDVKNYLTEIKNEVVTIVGGPNSVSEKVVEELEAIPSMDKVDRIKGDDRYKTAIEVAKKTYTSPKAILFADANGFADALVAGAVTNKIGAPIILTNKNTVNNDVKTYVTANKTAVQIIVGGPNSITDAVQKILLGLK